jgi:hypothetical protein
MSRKNNYYSEYLTYVYINQVATIIVSLVNHFSIIVFIE